MYKIEQISRFEVSSTVIFIQDMEKAQQKYILDLQTLYGQVFLLSYSFSLYLLNF